VPATLLFVGCVVAAFEGFSSATAVAPPVDIVFADEVWS
jgi:hypothetical protein